MIPMEADLSLHGFQSYNLFDTWNTNSTDKIQGTTFYGGDRLPSNPSVALKKGLVESYIAVCRLAFENWSSAQLKSEDSARILRLKDYEVAIHPTYGIVANSITSAHLVHVLIMDITNSLDKRKELCRASSTGYISISLTAMVNAGIEYHIACLNKLSDKLKKVYIGSVSQALSAWKTVSNKQQGNVSVLTQTSNVANELPLSRFVLKNDKWSESEKKNIEALKEKTKNIQVTPLISDLCAWFQRCDSVLLAGVSAAGKTTVLTKTAAILQLPFYYQAFNRDTDPDKVLGQWVPKTEGSGYRFVESPLVTAFRNGGFFLADEVNMVSGDVTAVFHAVLDDQAQLYIEATGETIDRHPLFRMGCGINEQYSGTKPLNPAFLRRLKKKVRVSTMTEDTLVELCMKKFSSEISSRLITKSVIQKMAKCLKEIEDYYKKNQVRSSAIGISHLYSCIDQFIICKDWKKSAEVTLVNLSCEDEEVNKEVMDTIITKYRL